LYPDRIFGGVRRITNHEMAKLQGFVAGGNMTGRKRQKFEIVPAWSSVVLGMHFDFVGDFSTPHLLADVEGSRDKQNFIVHYRRGDALIAALLCNRRPEEVKKLQEDIRLSALSRQKK
jgi:hypothetical protein